MLSKLLTFLSVLFLIGCNSGGPAITPVVGTLTLDDKPLAGARVNFIPQGDTLGNGGAASTDDNGKYEIIAHRNNNRNGLLPGEYKVVVSRMLMPDGSPLPANVAPMESGAQESIPEPYCRRDITPLTATIGAEPKPLDFPLKSRKK